jgi:hypothetical protein
MWTVALWFFIIMYAINGFALWLDVIVDDYTLVDPFTNSTIAFPSQPNVTGTLTSINGSIATNSTGGGTGINIWDAAEYGWNSTIFVFNLLTGGFIFQTIASFVPNAGDTASIFGLIQGVVAFFLILTGLHFWRGIL